MKTKKFIVLFLFVSCMSIHVFDLYFPNITTIEESYIYRLDTSDSWNLPFKIIIDGNWSQTRDTYDWCDGSGILADPFVIENVTINGQNSGIGIIIQNTNDYFIINNCTFYNSTTGMRLINVNYGTINNCSVYDNDDNGMYLDQCSNNTISNCSVYENGHYGILIDEDCYSNLVQDNDFKDNQYEGLRLYQYCDYNLIFNNTFIGDKLRLVKYHDHNRIEDNILTGGSIVLSDWCFNNTISNNYLTGTSSQIYVQGSSNNTLQNNMIQYGIGIHIKGGYYNRIINNTSNHNERGIELTTNTDYNQIINNTFQNNQIGMRPGLNSDENIIVGNFVKGNNLGIEIYFSDDNLIYQNTFDNNRNAIGGGDNNKLDNGSIGNYWHDYDGIDDDDNGIGDTPYNITDGRGGGRPDLQDRYPIWRTKPTVIINSPSDNTYWNSTPLINVVATDGTLNSTWYNVSTAREFLESGIAENLRTDIWDGLAEGPFVIEFFANDSIGNINNTYKYTITKDTVAPLLQVISPLENSVHSNIPPEFSLSVSDANLYLMWYTLNDQTEIHYINSSGTIDQIAWNNLLNGNITITFVASDKAGNLVSHMIHVVKSTSPETNISSFDMFVLIGISLGLVIFLSLTLKRRIIQ